MTGAPLSILNDREASQWRVTARQLLVYLDVLHPHTCDPPDGRNEGERNPLRARTPRVRARSHVLLASGELSAWLLGELLAEGSQGLVLNARAPEVSSDSEEVRTATGGGRLTVVVAPSASA